MELRTTGPVRFLVAGTAAALLVLGVAACSDDDDGGDAAATDDGGSTGDDTGGGDGGGGDATIVAADFSLTDLTIGAGETFVLDNQGNAPHTATADDGSFDSQQVAGGSTSVEMTAPSDPGSYPFHCEIHPEMTATLTVE